MVYDDQRWAGIGVDNTGRYGSQWTVVHEKEKEIDNRIQWTA
jgi:hypothetical protein